VLGFHELWRTVHGEECAGVALTLCTHSFCQRTTGTSVCVHG
jgi:hypothetical protein